MPDFNITMLKSRGLRLIPNCGRMRKWQKQEKHGQKIRKSLAEMKILKIS